MEQEILNVSVNYEVPSSITQVVLMNTVEVEAMSQHTFDSFLFRNIVSS